MKRQDTAPLIEDRPEREQLERLADSIRYRKRFWTEFRITSYTLITVAAVAVLIAVLLLPVLQIYGTSMSPTLVEGDIVISLKGGELRPGEVIGFYYNNKILVKRVIAVSGDWVDIAEDGTVFVNSVRIDEPYVQEKAFGDCNIELPYQVPESRVFVMGDHREVSVDSRNTAIGCVAEEQIVGRIVFRVWPLNTFGHVNELSEEE